jgi:hypothetical protein
MSVQSFIPSMWQAELLESFKGQAIVEQITFPVPTVGGKLIINKMGAVAVKEYEGQVTYDDLSTEAIEVPFDQKRYMAIKIGDVEAAQVAGELRAPAVREGAYQLAKAVDEHAVAKIMASEAHKTTVALTKENVYEAIVDANRALDRKDVPANDRVIVCGFDVIAMLEKDLKANFHRDVVADGVEYRVNGVRLLPTNRVADATLIVMHKSAVAHGMQLEKMEALRLESSFSDAIRALELFAVEVVREEAIEIVAAK